MECEYCKNNLLLIQFTKLSKAFVFWMISNQPAICKKLYVHPLITKAKLVDFKLFWLLYLDITRFHNHGFKLSSLFQILSIFKSQGIPDIANLIWSGLDEYMTVL